MATALLVLSLLGARWPARRVLRGRISLRRAVLQSRISRVVFGAFEPKTGFLVSNNLNSEIPGLEIIGGVMEEECSRILSDWFIDKRSIQDMI